MKSLNVLEQSVGHEYLMDNHQKHQLIKELKRKKSDASQAILMRERRPQPHTNKIVNFNA